jgi:hypothetical protein
MHEHEERISRREIHHPPKIFGVGGVDPEFVSLD